MKRISKYSISLLMALSILTPIQVTKAETATAETWFTFDRDKGRITNYNSANDASAPKEVIIPSSIGGVPVKELGAASFKRKNITKVVIPDSVTGIIQPFDECDDLATIVLGTGVTKLDFTIGQYLPSLTTFSVPGTITSMTAVPFVGCDNLKEMIFEEGFQSIDTPNIDSWGDMAALARIVLPSTMTHIDATAFKSSSGITEIVIKQEEASSPIAATAPWGAANATVKWESSSTTTPTTSSKEVLVSYDSSKKIADPDNPSAAQWSVVIPKTIDFSGLKTGESVTNDITLKMEHGGALPTGSSYIDVSVGSTNGFQLSLNGEDIGYEMTYDDNAGISGTLNPATGKNVVKIGSLQDGRTTISSTAKVIGTPTQAGSYQDTLTFRVEKKY